MLENATAAITLGINDPLGNLDLQLALDLCYELHFQSFRGVDPAWEWDSQLLEIRSRMESVLLDALAAEISKQPGGLPGTVTEQLRTLTAPDPVQRLARFVERDCDLSQLRELLIHRSAERLKQPDVWLWSVPRLRGRTKEALARIEEDERPRLHLLARIMRSLGLDDRVGAYRDLLPASTLASVNISSLFGLRRQGRSAIVGQLAMRQVLGGPDDRACSRAIRRLGVDTEAGAFHTDSSTSAPAAEQLAAEDLADRLVAGEPKLIEGVLFGARSMLVTRTRCSEWILSRWREGESSLIEESLGFHGARDG